MDIEQLTAALADDRHAADPDSVLRAVDAKRHRRRVRRVSALALCAAAAVVALVPVVLTGTQPGMKFAAPAQNQPAAASGGSAASGKATANPGCGAMPLGRRLATATTAGASVVTATIIPNGSSPAGYVPVRLLSARTLRGPRIAAGTTAWLPAADISGRAAGSVFGVVWPVGGGGSPRPVLTAARVSDGVVLFGASACWGGADMPLHAVENEVARAGH